MTFEERTADQRIAIAKMKFEQTRAAIHRAERRLRAIQPKGEFYLTMQRRILASAEAMEAWQTFMISVQLVTRNSIPGITH